MAVVDDRLDQIRIALEFHQFDLSCQTSTDLFTPEQSSKVCKQWLTNLEIGGQQSGAKGIALLPPPVEWLDPRGEVWRIRPESEGDRMAAIQVPGFPRGTKLTSYVAAMS